MIFSTLHVRKLGEENIATQIGCEYLEPFRHERPGVNMWRYFSDKSRQHE
jgi:hypothetical protein